MRLSFPDVFNFLWLTVVFAFPSFCKCATPIWRLRCRQHKNCRKLWTTFFSFMERSSHLIILERTCTFIQLQKYMTCSTCRVKIKCHVLLLHLQTTCCYRVFLFRLKTFSCVWLSLNKLVNVSSKADIGIVMEIVYSVIGTI